MDRDVTAHLHWLAGLAPTRLTGGEGERAVQQAIAEHLGARGFRTDWQPFRFPRHIYGSLALHFGLALVFAALAPRWPIVAALGHLVVAASFFAETTLRRHLLRALWPKVDTRNLLMTWPAQGPLTRRIVCLAHVDSAYTGLMFHPPILKVLTKPPPRALGFLYKQLLLPFVSLLVLAGVELAGVLHPALLAILSVPSLIVFFFNFDILLRNRVVPGAADNLSGCAAQVTLGEAWARAPVPGVELVLAFTGAEEAGTGGAAHLARSVKDTWSPEVTEVLVLDTLSNGDLYILEEGELFARPIPEALRAAIGRGAQAAGQPAPPAFAIPAGATDALVFLVEGYRAAALTCIDLAYGAPRNYHHPNDTAANVDPVQLDASTRVAQQVLLELAGRPQATATAPAAATHEAVASA